MSVTEARGSDDNTAGANSAAGAGFAVFLQLERAARHAQTQPALGFLIVNETRRLFSYRQAALILFDTTETARVEAVAGVASLDRTAPFLCWLEKVVASIAGNEQGVAIHVVDRTSLPASLQHEWSEWGAAAALWVPLLNRDGQAFGAIWLARDEVWNDEAVLAQQLADAYAHAWLALTSHSRQLRLRINRKMVTIAAVVALVILLLPVRQSALTSAEIIAASPVLIAAPVDGVIASFAVEPNQAVRAGQELFRFDDTNLRSQRDVAQRTLEVAQADLRRAAQGAFSDATASAQVDLLHAQVALRQTELDYAQALFARLIVKAERDGIAVFADPLQWIGRPVKTGERILQIADPAHTELRIDLRVGQTLALQTGASIRLFLDNDPLHALTAHLLRASYAAEPLPDGTLAYRLDAAFEDGTAPPRIGLHGTAKVYGERAPLFMYLFRRPFSALRQALGL